MEVDKEKGQCDVFFVDTGESEWVPLSDLKSIPSRFLQLPFQAIECTLPYVKPTTNEWAEEDEEHLWLLTRSSDGEAPKTLYIEVMSKGEARSSGKHRYGVQLTDTSKEYDVELNEYLIASNHARAASNLIEKLFGTCSDDGQSVRDLCAKLLESQHTGERKVAGLIQKSTMKEKRENPEFLNSGIVKCLCDTLRYCWEPAACEILVENLALLAESSVTVISQINQGTIGTFCHILDEVNSENVQNAVTWAMEVLSRETRAKDVLIENGAIRILSKLLQNTDLVMIQERCLAVLVALLENIDERPQWRLLKPALTLCMESVCDHLKKTEEPSVINSALIFQHLAVIDEYRDLIRKCGGLTALCDKLTSTWIQQEQEHIIRALRVLAENSQPNKEVMNHCNVLSPLHEFAKRANLSEETKGVVMDLDKMLLKLIPSRVPQRSSSKPVAAESTHAAGDPPTKCATKKHSLVSGSGMKTLDRQPLPKNYSSRNQVLDRKNPEVFWCQSKWNILLTIQISNVKKDRKKVNVSKKNIIFRAVVDGIDYHFDIDLYEWIIPERSEIRVRHSQVFIGLKKACCSTWQRLTKNKRGLPYVKHDYDKLGDSSSGSEDNQEDEKVSPLDLIKRNTIRKDLPFDRSLPPTSSLSGCRPEGLETESTESTSDHDNVEGDFFDELGAPDDARQLARDDYYRL